MVKSFSYFYVGEASGKVSAHVPYLKGDFEVTGLPDGVSFKKPTAYGSNTIQDIMKNADKIKFKMIEPKQLQLATPIVDAGKQATHSRILEKIIDGDKVARVLSGDEQILEQDLEVLNLDLLAREFHVLISDLNRCFEKDAFLALIANYQSGLSHEGYVLPLYTESEEAFWLFYFPGSSCKIEKLHPEDKIWGYWLDKTSTELEYKLLHDKKACINALNVVTFNGEVGSLRLKHSIPLHNGATIALPLDFKLSILRCLNEQGFL